jgi:hypothetical protein
MTAARPRAMLHAFDRLLIVGVMALLCGMSLVVAGLHSPDRALDLAVPGVQAAALAHGTIPSFPAGCACERLTSRAAADTAAVALQTTVHAADVIPAPRRMRERVAGDGLGQAMVQSSDGRNALPRTAMALVSRPAGAERHEHGCGAGLEVGPATLGTRGCGVRNAGRPSAHSRRITP